MQTKKFGFGFGLPLLLSACSAEAQFDEDGASPEFSNIVQCASSVQNDPTSALESARNWIERDDGIEPQQCLSFAYAELGEGDQAIAAMQRAAEIAELTQSWRAPALWSDVATLAIAEDRQDDALAYFERALAIPDIDDDARGEIITERAQFFVSLGDYGRAEEELATARELIPYSSDMWLLSANLAFARGDEAAGADHLTRAYAADPLDGMIAFQAGEIAYSRGVVRVAREAWGRALELEPNSSVGAAAAERLHQTTEAASLPPET